jgi:hypothetical protein
MGKRLQQRNAFPALASTDPRRESADTFSIQCVQAYRDGDRQPAQSLNQQRRDLRTIRNQREMKADR